jgi:DNA polymerase-1
VNDKGEGLHHGEGDLATPKDTYALLGEQEVIAKWDVPPTMIGDVLAIAGDSIDNIPGAGIGRKAAAALLKEHGGLESLLNNLDNVKSARSREKLVRRARADLQNRKMVELDCDTALPPRSTSCGSTNPDYPGSCAPARSGN